MCKLLLIKYLFNWRYVDFLISFERNFRFEIGWKLENCLKLVLGFFNRGFSKVVFWLFGMILVDKDKFMMVLKIGISL